LIKSGKRKIIYLPLSIFFNSINKDIANITSLIHAAAETSVPLFHVVPNIKETIGITIAATLYPFDSFSREYGNRCDPNAIAYTIIILSDTALNTHMAINR
jgi:hypothetical protein